MSSDGPGIRRLPLAKDKRYPGVHVCARLVDTLLSASTVHAYVHDVDMVHVVCACCKMNVAKCMLRIVCCMMLVVWYILYCACYVILMHVNHVVLMHVLPSGYQENHFGSSAEEERCYKNNI